MPTGNEEFFCWGFQFFKVLLNRSNRLLSLNVRSESINIETKRVIYGILSHFYYSSSSKLVKESDEPFVLQSETYQ